MNFSTASLLISNCFEVSFACLDFSSKYSREPPHVLDVTPTNLTISPREQAKIQCKVYSKRIPVIWWFKQSDNLDYDIKYNDKFYRRINSTLQVYAVPGQANVYLSKMSIFHAGSEDSGLYVCVAMTESGKDYRSTLVTVLKVHDSFYRSYRFYLLFLIPLVFALVPISLWCYFRSRWKGFGKDKSHFGGTGIVHVYKFQDKMCTTHV